MSRSRRSTRCACRWSWSATGPTRGGSARLAGPTVRVRRPARRRGRRRVLQGARALVVTAIEEFGIAAVEARRPGRPVIARARRRRARDGRRRRHRRFWSGGADELAAAVLAFDDAAVDPGVRRNAARFDSRAFQRGIRGEIAAAKLDAELSPLRSEQRPLASTRLIRRAIRET